MIAIVARRCADFASGPWRRRSAALTRTLSARPDAIVRGFDGDLHVVRMRLPQAGAADAHEARLRAELLDRARADVAHAEPQAADELMHERRERPARGDATLDAFGHELAELRDVLLPVAIARSLTHLHRAERAHTAIRLELPIGRLDDVARRLVHAREQPAEHHGVRAGADGLRDVAGFLDAAVAADRHAALRRRIRAVIDRGDLRHARARDDTRGADRARAHADLHAVGARGDELLRALGCGDVATDDLHAV